MNLRQLRYFLAVAEEGSFSKAAAALHMTQPPLSLAVSQLEKELGARLLERHTHGVSKTEAGEYLAANGFQLILRAGRIESHVKALGQGLTGRLHIASVPSFSWSGLPPLLKNYAEQSPGVEVELSDPAPAEVLSQVSSGLADVGFVATGNTGSLRDSTAADLRVALVQEMPLVAVLPPGHRGAPETIDLSSLMDETWMVPQRYAGFPGLIELIEDVWAAMGKRPATVRTVATLQTAIPLVAAGMGISIMPSAVAKLAGENIVIRRISQAVHPLEGTMVWPENRTLTPAAQRFVDLVMSISS